MNQESIIAHSPRFMAILDLARRVAPSCANVLITGESGTGKEIVAKLIHDLSARGSEKFVPINCSAIPDQLLEAELFGHAKGAFTGAHIAKAGLFEEAHGGTLFLDEIGDMDLHLQAKILRVIQEKQVKRVGENHYRAINIRILAATHNDLKEDVQNKKFREDLYFRLRVVPIDIPPLRERREDIVPLAHHFLRKYSLRHSIPIKSFSSAVQDHLEHQSWTGNVRELENSIERAVVLCEEQEIGLEHLESSSRNFMATEAVFDRLCEQKGGLLPLEDVCQKYIEYALQINHGAREKTAKDLGIDRKTLYRRTHSSTELPNQHRA